MASTSFTSITCVLSNLKTMNHVKNFADATGEEEQIFFPLTVLILCPFNWIKMVVKSWALDQIAYVYNLYMQFLSCFHQFT